MTVLAAVHCVLAGACWFAAATHLLAGVRQSFSAAHLTFALLALLSGLHTLTFVWLHGALDVAEYVAAMRWALASGALSLAVVPWFVHFYTSAGSRAVAAALSVLYGLVAILSVALPYGAFAMEAPELIEIQLWWGETATVHDSLNLHAGVFLYWGLHLCSYIYAFHACRTQYRRGQRGQSIALATAAAVLAIGTLGAILVSAGGLRSIYFAQFSFVALVLLMMFWLSGDESFRTVVSQASDGIFIADSKGAYTHVNAAGCALLGYTREEFARLRIFDVVPPEDLPLVHAEREALLAGKSVRRELRFRRKDGSLFVGELSAKMLSDGRLIGVVRDMSERQRIMRTLEERVAARTAEYAELNRQLESFSYSVSHDLRAPVRAVAAFSTLLLDEHARSLDGIARRHLSRIKAAAEHMNELIEGLLQLANVSHQPLRNEQVDLGDMARQVMARLREREPTRRVEFVHPSSLMAMGDARLISIAMLNLLENAWKYTSRLADARIEFRCEYADGEPVYCVCDNGAGFDMQFSDQLFKPFKRLHSPTEFAGAGIGLATVARIIERHGGRIWARSAPDEGATFCFTLAGRVAGDVYERAPASRST